MYDFKDPKTSGVVTVTKNWDDSSSNDERTIPDISISTEKPRKSTLGYGITYYGNGLTFADGSSVNDIVVNSSGKIVSGQYKELSGSLGWYSDKACTQKVEIGTDGLPVSGVVSDLDLYTKPKTFVLKTGSEFNDLIRELLRLLNSRASYWAPIESGLFLCFSYPAAVVFRGMPLLPVA